MLVYLRDRRADLVLEEVPTAIGESEPASIVDYKEFVAADHTPSSLGVARVYFPATLPPNRGGQFTIGTFQEIVSPDIRIQPDPAIHARPHQTPQLRPQPSDVG